MLTPITVDAQRFAKAVETARYYLTEIQPVVRNELGPYSIVRYPSGRVAVYAFDERDNVTERSTTEPGGTPVATVFTDGEVYIHQSHR